MEDVNACELLIEEAHKTERLELLLLSLDCETLEEFRAKLRERLSK